MKTQARKRYTFLAFALLVVGSLVLSCFLWVKHEQRQYAMNRELIASFRKGDLQRTLKLVEDGADPNTRVIPLPAPTWQELLKQLLHRPTLSANNSPTAFMVVSGDHVVNNSPTIPYALLDDPETQTLAQVMLVHKANVNARDEIG